MSASSLSLNLKRKADTLIGLPILVLVGFFARLIGFVLRRPHAVAPVRSILVIKFQGIGSLAMALESLGGLRQLLPNTKFIFWGTPATAALARATGLFSEVHVLEDRSLSSALTSVIKTLTQLVPQPIDWAFDLEVYSKLSSVLLTMTCARNRAGFAVDSASARAECHTHLVFFNRYRYIGESFAKLFSLANHGLPIAPARVVWSPPPSLPENLIGEKYIVINPNVGELAPERAWPLNNFALLLKDLEKTYPDFALVLVGKGAGEVQAAQYLKQAVVNVVDLTDQLSLSQLIACLKNAELVITADTSVLHLATLTDSKVVALFGPTLERTYFQPTAQQRSIVLSSEIFCRPCVHHWPEPPCAGQNLCMQMISPKKVLDAATSLLSPQAQNSEQHYFEADSVLPASEFVPGVVYRRPN